MTPACCSRCGLTVRYMPGFEPPEDGLPEGWTREGRSGSLRCLRCRREQAAQDAEDAARDRGLTGWKVKHAGQHALVALELERDPDASNAVIAKRLGLGSAQIVKKLRGRTSAAYGPPRGGHRGDAPSPSGGQDRLRSVGQGEPG